MKTIHHYRVEFEDGTIVDTDTVDRKSAAAAARYQTGKTLQDRIVRIERISPTGATSSA